MGGKRRIKRRVGSDRVFEEGVGESNWRRRERRGTGGREGCIPRQSRKRTSQGGRERDVVKERK